MKDTLFFAAAMVAERLVSFFLLPILTKSVSPEEYAIWSQSIVISGAMIPLVLLGFQTAVVKFFPLWEQKKQLQNSALLFVLTTIFLLLGVVVSVMVVMDHTIATLLFGNVAHNHYVQLLAAMLVSEALFELLVGILRATSRIQRVSIYLLLKGLWRNGVIMWVLMGIDGTFYQAFYGFVLFQFLITVLIYLKEVQPFSLVLVGWERAREHWGKILQFSLPLVPLAALTAANNFVDRLFLIHLHGLEMVAVYSAAFSLAAIGSFFYSVLGFTLFPELSKRWAREKLDEVSFLMQKVMVVYLSLLLPFIAVLLVVGSEILQLLTSDAYNVSSLLLLVLASNIGLFGVYQIAIYLFILQYGSQKVPLYMGGIVSINVFLNALLVPIFDLFGAATAGFISNSLLVWLFMAKSRASLAWSIPWRAITMIALRAIVAAGVIGGIMNGLASEASEVIVLLLALVAGGILYLLLDYRDRQTSFFSVIRSYKQL